jgi:hypothetical protein
MLIHYFALDFHIEVTKDGLTWVLKMPRNISLIDARLRITAALNRPAAYSELKAYLRGKPAKDATRVDTPETMQAALEVLNGAVSRARKNTPVLVIVDLMVCCFFFFASSLIATIHLQVSKHKRSTNAAPADPAIQARLDGCHANLLKLRQRLRCDAHSVQGDVFCLVPPNGGRHSALNILQMTTWANDMVRCFIGAPDALE